MTELKGANVVVTGGGAGVGRALALEAARRGARVVIASNSDATEAVETITAAGGQASWVDCDISDYQAMVDLAAHVRDAYGGAHVLVNNAGSSAEPGAGLDTADPGLAARLFMVNVLGVFNGIRAFAADLRAADDRGEPAYVLNVGSEHSLGVPPHVMPISPYTVSKYATLGFTDVARRDFADSGVGVTMLAPGWVLTELVQSLIEADEGFREAVSPYAQTGEFVAYAAFDGMLAGHYIVATNPASREFAMEHAYAVMAEVQRLPLKAAEEDPHDGTGDPAKCPVAHSLLGSTAPTN
ncbi:SDR family NAD(P)-dependent oxidoreductase [Nocardia aurea]|uniref:SDR family NAD(P)-dependent oxidoreductase n=1 Tax=Nocardia aurea TaxID=2144174 RepID=UPI000D688144|nr:SDR family oxidoreductase [Nocardia aurea]